jgi:hypothetical protein
MINKISEYRKKRRPLRIKSAGKAVQSFEWDLESGDNPEERRIMFSARKGKRNSL